MFFLLMCSCSSWHAQHQKAVQGSSSCSCCNMLLLRLFHKSLTC
jgi:hypothetical protein